MAVTGDVWLSLSLAQMVPDIDPNNPGASASLIRDKVNEVEIKLQDTISAANGVIAATGSLLGHANVVGSALLGAQAGIEELVQNAGNTGVYFKLLGICPDFPNSLMRNNQDVASEVANIMLQPDITGERSRLEQRLGRARVEKKEAEEALEELGETEDEERLRLTAEIQDQEQIIQETSTQLEALEEALDPCVPNFQGDTAYIGGILGLIGAPNPLALWEKLKVLAEIFPGLKDVVFDAAEKVLGITDEVVGLVDNFSIGELEQRVEDLNNFVGDLAAIGENPLFNVDQLFVTNGCDKWACSRLKDIMPSLDSEFPGSPANIAVEELSDITAGVVGTLQQVASLQGTAGKLIGEIGAAQADLNALKRAVFEFGDNLASTGVFLHPIGRDASLRTNGDFVAAVREALFDRNDPGRPTFRGESALTAGFLIIVGAPDPLGLRNEFDAVAKAIQGFDGKLGTIVDAAARTEEAFNTLRAATQTSDVEQQFRVSPTAPQRGGTDSTLITAAEALVAGQNPFTAASLTVEQSKQAAREAAFAAAVAKDEANKLTADVQQLQSLWTAIVRSGGTPTSAQEQQIDELVVDIQEGISKTNLAVEEARKAAARASVAAASVTAEKAEEAANQASLAAQQAALIVALVQQVRS